jgi:hypothetical protein
MGTSRSPAQPPPQALLRLIGIAASWQRAVSGVLDEEPLLCRKDSQEFGASMRVHRPNDRAIDLDQLGYPRIAFGMCPRSEVVGIELLGILEQRSFLVVHRMIVPHRKRPVVPAIERF